MATSKLERLKAKRAKKKMENKTPIKPEFNWAEGRLELDEKYIRTYQWGTKEFKPQRQRIKSKALKEFRDQPYWLVLDVTPMSKIVQDISILSKSTVERDRLIKPIQYIYATASSEKVLKMKKKKLEKLLAEHNNRVTFIKSK